MELATRATITIFHNNCHFDARARGYEHSDTVTEVFRYETTKVGHMTICNHAFELLNVGHEREFWGVPDKRAVAYRARRNRSLSVGDVIRIEQPAVPGAVDPAATRVMHYAVARHAGWLAVDAPVVKNKPDYGTTPIDATGPFTA